jgi:hypothetical protein
LDIAPAHATYVEELIGIVVLEDAALKGRPSSDCATKSTFLLVGPIADKRAVLNRGWTVDCSTETWGPPRAGGGVPLENTFLQQHVGRVDDVHSTAISRLPFRSVGEDDIVLECASLDGGVLPRNLDPTGVIGLIASERAILDA